MLQYLNNGIVRIKKVSAIAVSAQVREYNSPPDDVDKNSRGCTIPIPQITDSMIQSISQNNIKSNNRSDTVAEIYAFPGVGLSWCLWNF